MRLTGGIADFTSSITEVSAIANEPTSEVSKRILRFMFAQRTSDNRPVEIINSTDIGRLGRSDYGSNRPFTLERSGGAGCSDGHWHAARHRALGQRS